MTKTSSRALPGIAPVLLVLALGPLAAPASAAAQEEAADTEGQAVQRDTSGVSFDFQNADLRAVLTALAEAAELNIVYSNLPDRSVTLRTSRPVSPEGVRDLLRSVVESNELTMEEQNGVVRISLAQEAPGAETQREEAEPGPSPDAPPRLFVHRLAHADAATVAQTVRTLFGLGGGGGLVGGLGALGAPSGSLSQSLRQQAAAGYQNISQPPADREGARRQLPGPAGDGQAREGEDEAGGGTSVLLQGPVEIVPDNRTNSLLVLANPADFETVRSAIEKLDRRPLQVLIEVLIVEIQANDNLSYGTTVDVPVGADEEGVGVNLSGQSAGDIVLSVLGIGSVDASAVLAALSQSNETKILSRPVVMAQNNQEARILVGDQRPFVQLSRATEGGARDEVVQYRNVGTELRIRPTINRDGFVNLEVLQEVSNATQQTQFNAPVINTRESETNVLIRDGHTAVLGGLIDRQQTKTKSGVPLLKDIPVLGGLFGSTSTQEVASELFILITPHVLRTDEDMEEVRRQLQGSTESMRETIPEPVPLIEMDGGRADSLPATDTVPTAPPDSAGAGAGGGGP